MTTKNSIPSFEDSLLEIQSEFNSFLKAKKAETFTGQESFEVIPTGIEPLDYILGGGVALGTIMMLTGRPGCGKSSLAANILGAVQKHTQGKCLVDYIDTEGGMTQQRLESLGAINILPKQSWTLEKIDSYIEKIMLFKDEKNLIDLPCVIVMDSLASAITEKEMSAKDPKEIIGYKARVLSMLMSKYMNIFPKYNITLILINQLRDQVSISMMPTAAQIKGLKQGEALPGGRAVFFAVNQLVYLNDNGNIDASFGFNGKQITAYCIKNRLFNPLVQVKLSFSYISGYSNFWSKIVLLKEHKYLLSSGGWWKLKYFTREDGNMKTFRAKDMVDMYINDKQFRDSLNKCYEEFKEKALETIQGEDKFVNPDKYITDHSSDENKIETKEDKSLETAKIEKPEIVQI